MRLAARRLWVVVLGIGLAFLLVAMSDNTQHIEQQWGELWAVPVPVVGEVDVVHTPAGWRLYFAGAPTPPPHPSDRETSTRSGAA